MQLGRYTVVCEEIEKADVKLAPRRVHRRRCLEVYSEIAPFAPASAPTGPGQLNASALKSQAPHAKPRNNKRHAPR